ncbi:putative ribonuclease H-like domain-containing protein [Tanacetum coccineum]|uniref:Ribonuclease H-like domain-containing protein n=1 Tax=Tanacetum coccineum TaxID=301880 RepID=A0ABQ5I2Z8_9ASTR
MSSPCLVINNVGSIEPFENPLDTRELESSSYHAFGACWELCIPELVPLVILKKRLAPLEKIGSSCPKTTKQLAARRNQERVKSILLLAIPDEYLLKFHNVADAKSLWEAIKSRFGGNVESKKMQKNVLKHQFENFSTASNENLDKAFDRFQKLIRQLEVHGAPISKEDINQKFLRSLPPSWNQIALIMRNKPDIDEIDIDDLYNNLRVYEDELKRSSGSNSASQNLAFLSFKNTNSTNEVCTANGYFGVSTTGGINQVPSTPCAHDVAYSFFAQPTTSPQLKNEDFQQMDGDDLEELDLRWQVAMLTVRVKKFIQRTERNVIWKESREKILVTMAGECTTNESSSKQLVASRWSRGMNCQMSARDKTGLGYGTQLNELSSNHETDSENSLSIFDARSSDEENTPENDRFSKNRYKAVPPPITGNFLTPRADISFTGLDEYAIRNKIIESQTTKLNTKTSETAGQTNDANTEKPKSASEVSCVLILRLTEIGYHYRMELDDEEEVNDDANRPKVSTVRPVCTARRSVSTARPVCTARPSVSTARPVCTARPSVSTVRSVYATRPIYPRMDNLGFKETYVPSGGINLFLCICSADVSKFWYRRLGLETQLSHNVKIIRCDNGTEFKNHAMNEFCAKKGIKREFSVARTPQQNKAVNTACYVLNRVLVSKPQNKTHYELLIGTQDSYVAGSSGKDKGPTQEYILLPLQPHRTRIPIEDVAPTAHEKPSESSPKDNDIQDSKDVIDKEGQHQMPEDETVLDDELRSDGVMMMMKMWCAVADSNNWIPPLLSVLFPCSKFIRSSKRTNFWRSYIELNMRKDLNKGSSAQQALRVEAMLGELLQFKLYKGIVVKNKARLVAQGFRQEEGIDYDEVFAPVARIEAIRLFLAFASYMGFTVYQMDVKSAFLMAILKRGVLSFTSGFVDPAHLNKGYKGIKALYGLHQAPRAWYETLSSFLMENGFRRGTIDKTLFIKKKKSDIMLVQVYVDDIIFGSTKKSMCIEFEECMHKRFQMSSMGELTFFLGLQVKQQPDGIFISQDKYVADILKKFDFLSIRTTTTPIESNKPLVKDEDGVDVDVHVYRSMIGSLMYLTASRPNIMFAVCACARFQVTLKALHLNAVKRIFRYLKHQPKLGLWYPRDSPFELEAYSDSDYGGASLDRKSTTGGCQFLGRRLISWQCKKQTIVANSTTEAEYVAAANCCGQVLWIQNQMMDYGFNFMNTKIHIDNESTISVIKNLVAHSRTKHIEIRFHFIRDCYEKRLIEHWIIESVATIEGRQDDLVYSLYRMLCEQTDFANGKNFSRDVHLLFDLMLVQQKRMRRARLQNYIWTLPLYLSSSAHCVSPYSRRHRCTAPSSRTSPSIVVLDLEGSGGNHGGQANKFKFEGSGQEVRRRDNVYYHNLSSPSLVAREQIGKEDFSPTKKEGYKVFVSTTGQQEYFVTPIKGKSATQIAPTTTLTPTSAPTPTMFGDDETIAQINIDLRSSGKKRIEGEVRYLITESGRYYESLEKKFKQLANDEEVARKVQEEWEAEEENKRLAEEEATKVALTNEYDFIQARINADKILAEELQKEEREKFTIKQRAKFLHDTIAYTMGNLLLDKEDSELKTKTFEEIQIKEMNEESKDPEKKRLKKRVVNEEDTSKVPAKQEATEQGTKKRKSGHVKMIARKRPILHPDDDSDDEHRNDLCVAYTTNNRTASNRATGVNDSSKSIPSF